MLDGGITRKKELGWLMITELPLPELDYLPPNFVFIRKSIYFVKASISFPVLAVELNLKTLSLPLTCWGTLGKLPYLKIDIC